MDSRFRHFNIVGSTFAGDESATHGKQSKYIKWYWDGTRQTSFHVDSGMFQPSPTPLVRHRFGWILESEAIIPDVYKAAPDVLDCFTNIFTHSQELLDLDPRFKLAPVGTYWIKEPGLRKKSKLVSMVSSNKTMCAGHHKRLDWVEKLSPNLDMFGRGFNEIERKETALDNYMFSVAIENCEKPNYFTEKIGDCFATCTIPVYLGCPNIGDYFNMDGIIVLDDSFNIEDLTEELYLSKLDAVMDNLERVKQYEIPEDYIYEHYFKT